MTFIQIDSTAVTPPFEQVKSQIIAAVDAQMLAPGDKLPTVRRLAGDLGLAANTVARAYRELEALGVVQTRGRKGTYVAGDGVERVAREAAANYVNTIQSLGIAPAEALTFVTRALET